MIKEKLIKYFEQDIALAVISGLQKGAECEFSKVTVRPFTSNDGIKYQFEYTVKAQVKHKNVSADGLVDEIAALLENYSHSVWCTAGKTIFISTVSMAK